MFFPLGSLYILYHTARIHAAFGRLRTFSDGYGGFRTFSSGFSGGFGGFRNGFGGIRELRAFRTALGIIVHRLELRARCPLARWRLNRRALFAVSLLPANCAIPAQIPAHLPRLQRYSPNGDVLFRTVDLFLNCGMPSRAAWFSFSCGNSSRMAVSLRAVVSARACLAHLTVAAAAAETAGIWAALSAGGKFGFRRVRLANGWGNNGLDDGLAAGARRRGTRLTSGLPILRAMREMQRSAKRCNRGVICLSVNARSLASGGTWELKMLLRGLTECP